MLKKNKWIYAFILTSIALILALIFINLSSQNPPIPYLQISSETSQIPSERNNRVIKMESIDAKKNIDVDENYENILIKEDGIYFIMAAVQVGAVSSITKEEGWVDVWLNLNKEFIGNSNTRCFIGHNNDTQVLICQGVYALRMGDSISLGFSSSDASFGAVTFSIKNEPVIPSVIFSMFKINSLY